MGKYDDAKALAQKRKALEARGWVCTFDWMTFEKHDMKPETLGKCAQKDLEGVMAAEWCIAVMDDPAYAYRGTFTELGAAFALGKNVIILTPKDDGVVGGFACKTNIFYHYGLDKSNVHYVHTWDEALAIFDGAASPAKRVKKEKKEKQVAVNLLFKNEAGVVGEVMHCPTAAYAIDYIVEQLEENIAQEEFSVAATETNGKSSTWDQHTIHEFLCNLDLEVKCPGTLDQAVELYASYFLGSVEYDYE